MLYPNNSTVYQSLNPTKRKVISLEFSNELALVMIKGELTHMSRNKQARLLLQSIRAHVLAGKSIKIYIKITNIDFSGTRFLLKLAKSLKVKAKRKFDHLLLWNANEESIIEDIAENFAKLSNVPLTLCNI